MKKISCIVFLLSFQLSLFAGGENYTIGAAQSAQGGTYATAQNVFSVHNNIAGIAFLQQYSFGAYADRPFLVKNINHFNVSVALPFQKIGAFGLDVNFFGYQQYNETKIGIGYARAFGEKVSAGLKFDYLRLYIKDQQVKNTVAFGVGLQYQPLKVLRIGACVYNPIPLNIDKNNKEKLATTFALGLAYLPTKKLTISIDAEKEIDEKFRFKAGVEYQVLEPLFVRIGAATQPTLVTFGIGTAFKNIKIDAAASWHMQLGITPHLSFIYQINPKVKKEND